MDGRPEATHDVKTQVGDEALVARRRGQIVAAAVELFSRKGFYRTTIQEVAKAAGISAGLVYQYVSDKEDVLLLVLLSVLDSYSREIPAALEGLTDPLDRFRAAVTAYCRVVDQRRDATVLAYRSTKSLPEDRRRLIKESEIATNGMIAACIADCVAKGLMRPVKVELAAYKVVTFAHAWALKHWRLKELTDLDGYIAEGLDFFAHALLTMEGRRCWEAARGSTSY